MSGYGYGQDDDGYDYAHVVDGVVVNTSRWDGVKPFTPRPNETMVAIPFTDETDEESGEPYRRYHAGIGWDYVDGQFVDNRPVVDFSD